MLCRNYKPSYLFKLYCILIVHKKFCLRRVICIGTVLALFFKTSYFFGIMNLSYYIFNVNTFVSLKKRREKSNLSEIIFMTCVSLRRCTCIRGSQPLLFYHNLAHASDDSSGLYYMISNKFQFTNVCAPLLTKMWVHTKKLK